MPSDPQAGPLRIGDVFLGKYHILEVMGRGGFGCVYRARSEFIGREVAIKVIDKKGSSQALSRGQQEAVILGKLKHPNIVEVYDADISPDGQLYIIMELLEGKTLGDRLRHQGPLEVTEGLKVLEGLCDAIASAHKAGVFHRDIKPANIFLCDDGTPKVLDFGIAKMVGSTGVRTAPNMVVGTSLYVSPEQLHAQSAGLGHKPAPELSDIYALGLVAFQMFHGQHPLILVEPSADFRNPQVVWRLQVQTKAPLLEDVIPGFPSAVSQLVRTAVAKDPAERLPSMAEFGKKARIARLHYSADESEAHFTPIPRRETPHRPSRPADTEDAASEGIATRPLERKGTRKLFQDIPRAIVERSSSVLARVPSKAPRGKSTPPTRRDAPQPTTPPPAETPQPASRTITFLGPSVSSPSAPRRRMTFVMAAVGLVLGMAGTVWLDPLGIRAEDEEPEFIIEGTSPLEPTETASAASERMEDQAAKDEAPAPKAEEPAAEEAGEEETEGAPEEAAAPDPKQQTASQATENKPKPPRTLFPVKKTPKPAPALPKSGLEEDGEPLPPLPKSGLGEGNEPWLE